MPSRVSSAKNKKIIFKKIPCFFLHLWYLVCMKDKETRNTPETDGITFFALPMGMPPYDTVPAEFAKRLERERDEAREALAKWENAAEREFLK